MNLKKTCNDADDLQWILKTVKDIYGSDALHITCKSCFC